MMKCMNEIMIGEFELEVEFFFGVLLRNSQSKAFLSI